MYDIQEELRKWMKQGQRIALATVIKTWGSSPREAGAKMAVNDLGEMAGSVSGGCVEGAVVETALTVLRSGGSRYLHFGVADETAWEVGLACGGEIDVFVHELDEGILHTQLEAMESEKVFGTLTRLEEGQTKALTALCVEGREGGCFSEPGIPPETARLAGEMFAESAGGLLLLTETGGTSSPFFLDVQRPQPVLVIVGGAHISIALVRLARAMGYRTIVVDPRRAFGSEARFHEADRLVQSWPDDALREIGINRSTAVAVLSHDPKLDDPALIAALSTNAFYIGALGSRGTQEKRRRRLLEAGVSEKQIARIHGPIGLNLGGRTPEEIALGVMAEIVRVSNGY